VLHLIHEAYVSDDKTKTFFHGHSYTASPTACSAALASMDLMEEEETWMQIRMIEEAHQLFLKELSGHKACADVRVKGTILAIELRTNDATHYLNNASEGIASFFLKKGILLRPLGNVFYLIPPYCITREELHTTYFAIKEFLDQQNNFIF
jgi:adenosylmethionine---8-amino-7-oxononanoate aminotransferase